MQRTSVVQVSLRSGAVALLTGALLSGCTPAPVPTPAEGAVVAQNLSGPMGVYAAGDGSVWVVDSGTAGTAGSFTVPPDPGSTTPTTINYGDTAQIVHVDAAGKSTVVASLPSLGGPEGAEGASRITMLNGNIYVTSGHWAEGASIARLPKTAAVLKVSGTTVTEVADVWGFEATNNPDKQVKDSHAYGLAAGPDGNLWMTDAGGNDLLKVNPTTGAITLMAVFPNLPNTNPPAGVPPFSEPVPTGVAFLKDGAAYVSLLPGFPFTPGASKVVRVAADGSQQDYATGLSMTTDLQTGPDGNLYAVELGQFGEQGPAPATGSIVRIRAGGVKETVLTGLDTPTAISFNARGDAFITTGGAAAPNTGKVLRWDNFTTRKPVQAP
ncbi:ScyD/ScyE family protein [Deinococcus sonorensis]|uniref:ScyD/ScyE family protein n=2 Tax=Deinococcus sonorensis TaxID=309891 RepID=A0AAU7U5R2_9DEIO